MTLLLSAFIPKSRRFQGGCRKYQVLSCGIQVCRIRQGTNWMLMVSVGFVDGGRDDEGCPGKCVGMGMISILSCCACPVVTEPRGEGFGVTTGEAVVDCAGA